MKKQLTLTLITKDDHVLLGMKKRGFGEGKWNGFGGKVEENETIEEAACRETHEECGVAVSKLEKMGVIDFEFENAPGDILEVHVFRADTFSGTPCETEEMKPQWFHTNNIPFSDMWPDDVHWFPYLFDRKLFKGYFLFNSDENEIITHQLALVDSL